jgi:hypothetical protein
MTPIACSMEERYTRASTRRRANVCVQGCENSCCLRPNAKPALVPFELQLVSACKQTNSPRDMMSTLINYIAEVVYYLHWTDDTRLK